MLCLLQTSQITHSHSPTYIYIQSDVCNEFNYKHIPYIRSCLQLQPLSLKCSATFDGINVNKRIKFHRQTHFIIMEGCLLSWPSVVHLFA